METKTITRQELYQQVWSEPISSLSPKYNISDYELRKLCKELQIPLPKHGHWQRIRAGKQVPIPALPSNETVAHEMDFHRLAEAKATAPLSPQELLQEEIEQSLQKVLQVPAPLTNPDKLIAATRANIEERNVTYRFTELLTTAYGFLDVKVSRQSLNRAFRILDTLIKALQARGHRVMVSDYQAYIYIRKERYEVALREKLKRSTEIRPGNYSYDYTTTGILVLKIGPSWNGKEWQDGKVPLENRLSAIIAYLEWKTQHEEEWRLECQKEKEVRLEKERVLREQQARKEQELLRFKHLLQQAKRWHEAQQLRAYIAAEAQQVDSSSPQSTERKEWLAWAEQKANWYDPQVNLSDELLDEVDKETLVFRKKALF
ncbi:hypothetical protein ACSX1A_10855 [Pontibacter sp. MBLB2868]|uniref:hypothetical protein n=1 Tax=Pontibacter sp. MBLB2868 TaxID=3451555 RepID=UPI003F74D6D5